MRKIFKNSKKWTGIPLFSGKKGDQTLDPQKDEEGKVSSVQVSNRILYRGLEVREKEIQRGACAPRNADRKRMTESS